MHKRKNLWGSCNERSPDAWPELAYRAKGGQLRYFPGARGTPKAQLKGIRPMMWNGGMDNPSWGDRPGLGEGVGWGGIKAAPPHAKAGASPPPLALHNSVLLISNSTTPWKIFIYSPDLRNLGAGHGDAKPPHWLRRNRVSKFSLRWTKSRVMSQICLQTLPSS